MFLYDCLILESSYANSSTINLDIKTATTTSIRAEQVMMAYKENIQLSRTSV